MKIIDLNISCYFNRYHCEAISWKLIEFLITAYGIGLIIAFAFNVFTIFIQINFLFIFNHFLFFWFLIDSLLCRFLFSLAISPNGNVYLLNDGAIIIGIFLENEKKIQVNVIK